ncbi:MAG: uS17 family ribosomal protein [Candidatus Levyibacteriota bacterium]
MAKTFTGKVVGLAMQKTALVEVVRRTPHPLYKKLVKKSKKFKVRLGDKEVAMGEEVSFQQTRPLAKGVHFVLVEEKK